MMDKTNLSDNNAVTLRHSERAATFRIVVLPLVEAVQPIEYLLIMLSYADTGRLLELVSNCSQM